MLSGRSAQRLVTAAAIAFLFGALVMILAACGGDGSSGPSLSEDVAAGVVREKLGLENPGFGVFCKVIGYQSNEAKWEVRCWLSDAQGKRWSDWSVDDRSKVITQLPGGETGFPTKRAE